MEKRSKSQLIPHRRINSKWIIDLNMRAKTLKLVEETIGGKVYDFGVGKDFLRHKKHEL